MCTILGARAQLSFFASRQLLRGFPSHPSERLALQMKHTLASSWFKFQFPKTMNYVFLWTWHLFCVANTNTNTPQLSVWTETKSLVPSFLLSFLCYITCNIYCKQANIVISRKWSPGSSVSIIIRQRAEWLRNRGSLTGRRKGVFSTLKRPDQLWVPQPI